MERYSTWFADFELLHKQTYPDNDQITMAKIRINNQEILLNDMREKHAFDFTPSFSFFIECTSEMELRKLVESIETAGGEALMPLAD